MVGTFNSLSLPTLSANLSWSVQYNPTNVTLKVVSGLAGDYNQNGAVDAADYVVWRKNRRHASWLQHLAHHHFGQISGSGAGASSNAAVPEPATLVMMAFAAAGCWLRRGRAAWKFPTSR